jgi:hypothetical protein
LFQKIEDRCQRSEIRDQKTEARGQRPEDRKQRTDVRKQRTDARRQKTENRCQRTDVRNANSEWGIRKSESFNRGLKLHFPKYTLPYNFILPAFKFPGSPAFNSLPFPLFSIPFAFSFQLLSLLLYPFSFSL